MDQKYCTDEKNMPFDAKTKIECAKLMKQQCSVNSTRECDKYLEQNTTEYKQMPILIDQSIKTESTMLNESMKTLVNFHKNITCCERDLQWLTAVNTHIDNKVYYENISRLFTSLVAEINNNIKQIFSQNMFNEKDFFVKPQEKFDITKIDNSVLLDKYYAMTAVSVINKKDILLDRYKTLYSLYEKIFALFNLFFVDAIYFITQNKNLNLIHNKNEVMQRYANNCKKCCVTNSNITSSKCFSLIVAQDLIRLFMPFETTKIANKRYVPHPEFINGINSMRNLKTNYQKVYTAFSEFDTKLLVIREDSFGRMLTNDKFRKTFFNNLSKSNTKQYIKPKATLYELYITQTS